MRILLCLVSDDKSVRDVVNSAKSEIVPHTYRETAEVKAIAPKFDVRAVEFGKDFAIERSILAKLECWDGVCLLTDNLEKLSQRLRTSCFVGKIDPNLDLTQVIAITVRVLSNYFRVLPYMRDKGSMQALALPLENFDADELRELTILFAQNGAENLFFRNFQSLLAKLRKRHKPRRPKNEYKKHYFQDDQKKHFDYGHEDHGQFDTAEPHTPLCEISGNFRFGWKIPTKYHFNMMKAFKKGTYIDGNFPGCHSQIVNIPGQTHVNIFANDFHKPK